MIGVKDAIAASVGPSFACESGRVIENRNPRSLVAGGAFQSQPQLAAPLSAGARLSDERDGHVAREWRPEVGRIAGFLLARGKPSGRSARLVRVVQPSDITWALKRHTAAKHQLLKGYLDAWLGILGSWADHLLLIDGFAGPGEYTGGEPGSPVLMLDAFLRRRDRDQLKPVLHYLFIEENQGRCEHLQELLSRRKLPEGRVDLDVVCGDFAAEFPKRLHALQKRIGEVPPTFAFIDPFGAGDEAADLASELVGLPRCEALVYLPITHLARFVTEPDLEPTLDRVYAGRSWEPAREVSGLAERRQILQDAFIARLEGSCDWVRPFEIVPEEGKNSYTLFFGTSNKLGLQRMKDAMWKLDPVAGTGFRDNASVDHPVLFEAEPDLARLEEALIEHVEDRIFSIDDATDFTLTCTPFRDNGHLKPTLKAAEAAGRLSVVKARPKRRRGTFPDGTMLTFGPRRT